MNRNGWFRLALVAGGAMMMGAAGLPCPAQGVAPAPTPAPAPLVAPAGEPAATAVVGEPAAPLLPPEVQVVRFQAPEGVTLEVLGPAPEPVPVGDGRGLLTVGLRVGVGYRLRLANLPNRPGKEVFPVIELVGHLHRPPGIDPGKFPVRVTFTLDDIEEVVDAGRLATKIIYLEDPEQALPVSLPRDQIPTVTVTPAEEPLKVAAALGRVMAIVRVGGRTPTAEELAGPPIYFGSAGACPFVGPAGGRCPLPCGPAVGTPPPPGRPWMPKDEFLCDGGDHGPMASTGGTGAFRGIDPRDAVIRFQAARDLPRVLPTNVVCIYAPRFAEVRNSIGPNQNLTVQVLAGAEMLQRQQIQALAEGPKRLAQNQSAELNRHRVRPSGLQSRQRAGSHQEVRVLGSSEQVQHLAGLVKPVGPEVAKQREKPAENKDRVRLDGIKTAESAVVTGLVEGLGQQVMAWKPQEIAGVEVPPNKPGLAVVKRVSAAEAEPGDVVTFVIQYRNMGNVPIASVSVIDSLLPRLEYVAGSARGPAGTVFTAGENTAGSTELRWDLQGALAPGAEGLVSFDARVR